MVPIGAKYADYELSMTGLKTLTDRILAIPAISNTSKYFATFSEPLDTLVNSQVIIKSTLKSIIKHKNNKPALTQLPGGEGGGLGGGNWNKSVGNRGER